MVASTSPISPYTDRTAEDPEFEVPLERYPRKPLMAQVRKLSQVNGWRTTGILIFTWGSVFLAGWWAVWMGHWAAYVVAALFIASRQQVLGVLMHDAVHYLLYKNRTVNDVVTDLFISFPLGMSTDLYRATHFRHHLYANSTEDPDLSYQREDPDWFEWPKSRWGCFWVIVRSFLGLNAYKAMKPYRMWSPAINLFIPLHGKPKFPLRSRILFVLSTISIYAILFGTGIVIPAIFLWMIPGITLMNFINRLRASAEHLGTRSDHELNSTRTVIPSWIERFWIAPLGVNYHLEHHLFPSVPGPNLKRLHRLLMEDESFRSRAHVTQTYVGVVREFMTTGNPPKGTGPSNATN